MPGSETFREPLQQILVDVGGGEPRSFGAAVPVEDAVEGQARSERARENVDSEAMMVGGLSVPSVLLPVEYMNL